MQKNKQKMFKMRLGTSKSCKSASGAPEGPPRSSLLLWGIWLWVDFGGPPGVPKKPKIRQNPEKRRIQILRFFWTPPGSLPGRLLEPKRTPKSIKTGPKTTPTEASHTLQQITNF